MSRSVLQLVMARVQDDLVLRHTIHTCFCLGGVVHGSMPRSLTWSAVTGAGCAVLALGGATIVSQQQFGDLSVMPLYYVRNFVLPFAIGVGVFPFATGVRGVATQLRRSSGDKCCSSSCAI